MRIEAVHNLSSIEDCETVMRKTAGIRPDLYTAAVRRIAALGGRNYADPVEAECWSSLETYEAGRRQTDEKFKQASRTRQMIARRGIIPSFELLASRKDAAPGFLWCIENGFADLTAEAIVVRHSDRFSTEAVATAQARLLQYGITSD